MNKLMLFTGSIVLFACSILSGATHERPMLLRVALDKPGAVEFLREGRFDIPFVSGKEFAEIVADDYDYLRLGQAGLNPEIIHADLVAFYQSRFPVGATMGGFPTLAEAISFMDSLHSVYPNLITARDSIGSSFQGRAIWMVKISDNVDIDEDEPEMFINSLIHAREPMGLEATLRFMSYLLSNYGTDSLVTYLVDNREFYFVPVVNPDGYEYNRQTDPNGGGMWRKNRHGQGIDLNRNWGYMWGYDDNGSSPYPSDETYRGTGPFSEPETETLRQFINSRHFKVIMNFHTYGDYFLYPWGYINSYTDDQQYFVTIADSAVTDNGYSRGTAWELLYNTNGDSNDWQYGEQTEKPKIFGFVMEIGGQWDGFWPNPNNIPQLWNGVLPSLLYLSRIADNPYASGAPSAPTLNPISDVYADTFTVSWQHSDTLNPAVAYELKEMTGMQVISDGFESGTENWTLNGFVRRTNRRHSGTYSLYSGSANNYNGRATMTSPIDVQTGDTLQFWTWYSIENGYDYAYACITTDGGATYVNLPGNITTNSDPYGRNEGNGITGNSSTWVLAKFPLESYVGQSAIIALRYSTDGGVLLEGFYVDDLTPVVTFAQENILSSDITDNSYLISGRTDGQYYYAVRARDAQGQNSIYSNRRLARVFYQVAVDEAALPSGFVLGQNYPNPFNPSTVIEFSLPARSRAELSVYSITGAKVSTLISGTLEAGAHLVKFEGRDADGNELAAGVYFYRLIVGDKTFSKKMVMLK